MDFRAAFQSLGGEIREVDSKPIQESTKTKILLPDHSWQMEAWKFVDKASDNLENDPNGDRGRSYLAQRGFHHGTWIAHLLGFASVFDPTVKSNRPAIVLPWWDCDANQNVITAVKFRFLDDGSDGLRYFARRGGVQILYGLWSAIPEHHTLLLVEGEFNALSIWQCMPEGVTCLSFGSETGGRMNILGRLAGRYRNVVFWADDPKRSAEMRNGLGMFNRALRSPEYQGLKWDANKMLQERVLIDFLSKQLKVTCLGRYTNKVE